MLTSNLLDDNMPMYPSAQKKSYEDQMAALLRSLDRK